MTTQTYYVPSDSRWPIIASLALFLMAFGAGSLINGLGREGTSPGLYLLLAGALVMVVVLFGWFAHVVSESRLGLYSAQMDRSFRWGMGWFIFSEVMFFAAFFGALFYVRVLAVPWLGGEGEKGISNQLWQGFEAHWPLLSPPDSAQFPGPRAVISPWQIPLVNTLLLISSSFTATLGLGALQEARRSRAAAWLGITIALGLVFLSLQLYEYHEAYTKLGLTLHAGIYGATFFILTGFHGLHVTLGTLMLIIVTLRLLKGHFDAQNHFGLEAVIWYWHFVDVVWVGLFLFVYIL
ncbi:cytochrome c oxidase subunit 3 [Motiliproteus sp. SC1-56]|uniref:cytochrome c oxidase subunit 3 n=1 Tax=Motiliproteus sp. SC1-56 TaxID=2799565 RepID=UPI001A8EF471|nr:cytochrome c oxidase subunit 3 [Motiliproteus sp. SC1-56]